MLAFRDEVNVAPAVSTAPIVMDVQTALKAVLRSAGFADGLAKGLHEAAKALDKLVRSVGVYHSKTAYCLSD